MGVCTVPGEAGLPPLCTFIMCASIHHRIASMRPLMHPYVAYATLRSVINA